jgi:hypothetical protein
MILDIAPALSGSLMGRTPTNLLIAESSPISNIFGRPDDETPKGAKEQ